MTGEKVSKTDHAVATLLSVLSLNQPNLRKATSRWFASWYRFKPENEDGDDLSHDNEFSTLIIGWVVLVNALNGALTAQPNDIFARSTYVESDDSRNKIELALSIYGKTVGWDDDQIRTKLLELNPSQKQRISVVMDRKSDDDLQAVLRVVDHLSQVVLDIWRSMVPGLLAEDEEIDSDQEVDNDAIMATEYVRQIDEAVDRARADSIVEALNNLEEIWLGVVAELLREAETRKQVEVLLEVADSYLYIAQNRLKPVEDEYQLPDIYIPINPKNVPSALVVQQFIQMVDDYKFEITLPVPEGLLA